MVEVNHKTQSFVAKLTLALIRGYQNILSPLLGPRCRFYPSCSHYAYTAIQQHGVMAGIKLSILRLIKCHPAHPGGIDEVPKPKI